MAVSSQGVQELDRLFVLLFADLAGQAVEQANSGVKQTLDLSENYLSDVAFDAVQKFHRLYNQDAPMTKKIEEIHADVDNLVDNLMAAKEAGQDVDEAAAQIKDDARLSTERTTLAGIQRQLESLIRLDKEVKEKLVPVLSAMQFEDQLRQRMSHIAEMWGSGLQQLHEGRAADEVARDLAELPTMQHERDQFYETVIGEPAPAGMTEGGFLFDLED